jgi:hypothetical protein
MLRRGGELVYPKAPDPRPPRSRRGATPRLLVQPQLPPLMRRPDDPAHRALDVDLSGRGRARLRRREAARGGHGGLLPGPALGRGGQRPRRRPTRGPGHRRREQGLDLGPGPVRAPPLVPAPARRGGCVARRDVRPVRLRVQHPPDAVTSGEDRGGGRRGCPRPRGCSSRTGSGPRVFGRCASEGSASDAENAARRPRRCRGHGGARADAQAPTRAPSIAHREYAGGRARAGIFRPGLGCASRAADAEAAPRVASLDLTHRYRRRVPGRCGSSPFGRCST